MAKTEARIKRRRKVKVGPDEADFMPGVQGIASSLDAITLNGRSFRAEVSGALEDGSLERNIEGASVLRLDLTDSRDELIESPLLAESFDCFIDGLGFRFVKASKTGLSEPLELSLEDLEVARLRKPRGARKARRGKVTRAEFVRRLVREVKPPIPFYSPQLHKRQPIGSAAEGRANADAKLARRDPGLPASGKITVKHAAASAIQIRTIERSLDTATSIRAPRKALVAVVMCITQESSAGKDSGNAYQQNADWPGSPSDVENATRNFLQRAPTFPGGFLGWLRKNPGGDLGAGVQAVQRSAFPREYSRWKAEAEQTVDAYLGGAGARASAEETQATTGKYQFERKAKESTWDCSGRLAEEVNWRRYVSARIFYFLSETTMLRSKVRAQVASGVPGIEDVSFDYDAGKPISEVTVSARARAWGCPPGTVAEVAGCGPANGLFIVSKINAPLRRANSLCDITLKRPTEPLPEPAPKRKKNAKGKRQVRSASAGSSDDFAARVAAEIERIDRLRLPYKYGGGHATPAPRNGPFDCSSFVSRVLQAAGLDIPTMVSGAFASWGAPGPGEEVTIYANAQHVFMAVKTGGSWRFAGTSHENPDGGPGWHSARSGGGFTIRHPRGH